MKANNFNLRGIAPAVFNALKQAAVKQNTSMNTLILQLIEKGLGYSHQVPTATYHDLDKLAGTWSDADAKVFDKVSKDFEKIDQEMW